MRARDALATVDYADTERISQALARLEAAHKDSINDKNNFNPYNKTANSNQKPPTHQQNNSTVNHMRENTRNHYRQQGDTHHQINQNWRNRDNYSTQDRTHISSNGINTNVS